MASALAPNDTTRAADGVVLISCYELGHQPMGVAMPAAVLARAGFAPRVHDLAVDCFDPAWVAGAWFVGIAVPMHTALRLGLRAARKVRAANPHCHICFYGLYAALNADYLLANGADSCFGGEYEAPMLELVDALARHEPAPVRGVHLSRLDYPVPRRDGLPPVGKYAKLVRGDARLPAGYAEASRGCKHLCLHCPITPVYKGRFFAVPRETVLEDVARQVAAGARHITFGDPDFLNGPTHALRLAREFHAAFPGVTFDFTAKVEHLLLQRDLLPEFARCGCLFIVSAVESFSDVVLANLAKGHTRAGALEAFGVVRDAGIALRPTFVPFTPWTTLDDYLDMLHVIDAYALADAVDPVQYSVRLLVPPGAALLERDAIRPHLTGLDRENFSYTWTHPDPRMDALQKDVARLVERAALDKQDAPVTFAAVWALAHTTATFLRRGGPTCPPVFSAPPSALARVESSPDTYLNRARTPRLTESWFC